MVDELTIPDDREKKGLRILLSLACGVLIATLNYGQPLATEIAVDINLPAKSLGWIAMLPYSGYGIGLLMIVPLADLFENKIIVITAMSLVTIGITLLLVLTSAIPFLVVSFIMGIMAAVVQVLVPYGTFLVSKELQGKVVAETVTGVMLGVILSRPAAGWIADIWGWRSVFIFGGGMVFITGLLLFIFLPSRKPVGGLSYGQLLRSMGQIFLQTPILRRRGFYQACVFGVFSLFWTSAPILLHQLFHLSNNHIAWISMAAVSGAIAPPFASRLVDNGYQRAGTIYSLLMVAIAFFISSFVKAQDVSGIIIIIIAALLIGFGVTGAQVIGQRAIYALDETERARLNGLFTAFFFLGGSIGSGISGVVFSNFGWIGISVTGIAVSMTAFVYSVMEPRKKLSSAITGG